MGIVECYFSLERLFHCQKRQGFFLLFMIVNNKRKKTTQDDNIQSYANIQLTLRTCKICELSMFLAFKQGKKKTVNFFVFYFNCRITNFAVNVLFVHCVICHYMKAHESNFTEKTTILIKIFYYHF